jgi:hypothetical protein
MSARPRATRIDRLIASVDPAFGIHDSDRPAKAFGGAAFGARGHRVSSPMAGLTLDQVEIMAALSFELFGPRQPPPKIFIDRRHNEFAI